MDFEARLRELEAMVGKDAGMELFTDRYESLLNEVRAMPGVKFQMIGKMRKILFRQLMAVFAEYYRQRAIDKIGGSGQEEITTTTRRGMN